MTVANSHNSAATVFRKVGNGQTTTKKRYASCRSSHAQKKSKREEICVVQWSEWSLPHSLHRFSVFLYPPLSDFSFSNSLCLRRASCCRAYYVFFLVVDTSVSCTGDSRREGRGHKQVDVRARFSTLFFLSCRVNPRRASNRLDGPYSSGPTPTTASSLPFFRCVSFPFLCVRRYFESLAMSSFPHPTPLRPPHSSSFPFPSLLRCPLTPIDMNTDPELTRKGGVKGQLTYP